jgi:hypothetical protein
MMDFICEKNNGENTGLLNVDILWKNELQIWTDD